MVWGEDRFMNFAIFIISHERADRVETYDTLRQCGYTGQIFVVIDNEDSMLRKYLARFGDDVLVFDKEVYAERTDTLETAKLKASAVYARNAVEDFAQMFELDAFGLFDDDITGLRYRWVSDEKICSSVVKNGFDNIVDFYTEFLYNGLAEVAMPTSPFYMCGSNALDDKVCGARKGYGMHFRNCKYKIDWRSLLNEDLITHLSLGKVGSIILTLPMVCFETPMTGEFDGGVYTLTQSMSDFRRAFMATVVMPTNCKPILSKNKFVMSYKKDNSFPMIISSRYKK